MPSKRFPISTPGICDQADVQVKTKHYFLYCDVLRVTKQRYTRVTLTGHQNLHFGTHVPIPCVLPRLFIISHACGFWKAKPLKRGERKSHNRTKFVHLRRGKTLQGESFMTSSSHQPTRLLVSLFSLHHFVPCLHFCEVSSNWESS